jgi:hypothetical protein
MKTQISLLLALGALSASALELSPRFMNMTADGITIRRPYFADGSKKYSVTLNGETELIPYEDGALFRFVKLNHAEMRLRPSSFSVETKFEGEALERYQEAARKLLPQYAEEVVLEQQTPNPLTMNDWKSHRFIYKYKTTAGEIRESITFLNITPNAQVIVQVYAMDKDFVDASERAYDIIRRWHELNPDAVLRGI